MNNSVTKIISLILLCAILTTTTASGQSEMGRLSSGQISPQDFASEGLAIRHAMEVHKNLELDRLDAPEITFIGGTLWNAMLDFAAYENTAYIRCLCGFLVYDITDPTAPVMTDRIFLPYMDFYNRMYVHGHYLYLGDYHKLHIYDLSEPLAPQEVNLVTLSGIIGEMEVHDNLLFVGIARAYYDYEQAPGLYIFDISEPSAPSVIGKYESPLEYRDCGRFEVVGDLVFSVSTKGNCLEAIDIQDITRPAFIGSTYVAYPEDIIYDQGYVYVAGYYFGEINTFDVSTPGSPSLVGSTYAPEVRRMTKLIGSFVTHQLDTGTGENGIAVYDIVAPGSISRTSFTPTRFECYNFDIRDSLLLLPECVSRFSIYDFSDPYSPEPLYQDSVITWRTLDLEVTDDYAYIMNENPYGWEKDALIAVDMSDKQNPYPVSGLLPGVRSHYSRSHISINGDLLFLSGCAPARIVSIEDRANPVYLANFPPTGQICAATVARDNIAYTSADNYFVVGDITDPSNPQVLSQVKLVHPGTGEIELSGDIAYVAGRNTNYEPFESWLTSIDISDPNYVSIADSHLVALQGHYYATPDWQITRHGNYIYYAGGNTGVSVVEVAGTDGMETLFNYVPYKEVFSDVAFRRGYMFAASWSALRIFDATDPANPILVDHLPIAAAPRKIRMVGDYLYVSCWFGFCIFHVTLPDPICGDANASGGVDIDDAVHLISYIFAGGQEPDPIAAGDANCSGGIDIDDVVWLIVYIFAGGNAPCDIDGDGEPDC